MTSTDRILFRRVADGRNEHVCQWTGPWPPPPELWVLHGMSTGYVAFVDPSEHDMDAVLALPAAQHVVVERYRLSSASQQPDPAPEGAHWCRAAEYLATAESGAETPVSGL